MRAAAGLRLRQLRFAAARLGREQAGAVAIIAALCMVVLVGFVALALDVGMLFVEQTQLQKAVDAAALAGAQAIDLKNLGSTSASARGAQNYLTYNGVDAYAVGSAAGCEIVTNAATTVNAGPCATNGCAGWLVAAQRSVNLSFAPVLGISQGVVHATATAIASPISAAQNPLFYATWAGNPASWPRDTVKPSTPAPNDYYCIASPYSSPPPGGSFTCDANGGIKAGSLGPSNQGYIFEDTNYQSDVIYGDPNKCWDPSSGSNKKNQPECNPNWPASFTSNSFKGFLGPKGSGPFMSGLIAVGTSVQDQGGSQNQPDPCQDTNNGATPVVAPFVGQVTNSGGPQAYFFTIAAFRMVYINCPTSSKGKPWTLTIAPDQRTSQGVPGGNDLNGPIVVKLW